MRHVRPMSVAAMGAEVRAHCAAANAAAREADEEVRRFILVTRSARELLADARIKSCAPFQARFDPLRERVIDDS